MNLEISSHQLLICFQSPFPKGTLPLPLHDSWPPLSSINPPKSHRANDFIMKKMAIKRKWEGQWFGCNGVPANKKLKLEKQPQDKLNLTKKREYYTKDLVVTCLHPELQKQTKRPLKLYMHKTSSPLINFPLKN